MADAKNDKPDTPEKLSPALDVARAEGWEFADEDDGDVEVEVTSVFAPLRGNRPKQ